MKQIIIVITVILFFSGCDSNKGYKKRISEQKNKIKRLTEQRKKLRENLDSLSKANRRYKNQIEFLRTPKNKKIVYINPNSTWISEYICYKDNTVIHDINHHYAYIGEWRLIKDSLIFQFTKKAGKRGIGEPKKPKGGTVPAVYVYKYDEYVPYCEMIDKRKSFDWNKLSRKILLKINSQDDTYGFTGFSDIESNKAKKKYDITLPGRFSFASKRPLTKDELNDYSKRELRIMRNEIFARYGYIFNTKDIKTYFNKKKWYEPSKNNIDKYLSDLEKDNIKLIKEIEEK